MPFQLELHAAVPCVLKLKYRVFGISPEGSRLNRHVVGTSYSVSIEPLSFILQLYSSCTHARSRC